MARAKKCIILGLDGLDPTIVGGLLDTGDLPHLARLLARGGYSPVATTCPAQTPVAWSTVATGLNPGGHGIFDFVDRDPATYVLRSAFTRYDQPLPFLPPRPMN